MKGVLLALAVLLLVSFSACTEETDKAPVFYPLESDSTIEFNYSLSLTENGKTTNQESVLEIEPSEFKTVRGEKCRVFEYSYDGEKDSSICLFENEDGIFLAWKEVNGVEFEVEEFMPVLKKPFEEGSEWTWAGQWGDSSVEADFEITEIFGSDGSKELTLAYTYEIDGTITQKGETILLEDKGVIEDSLEVTDSSKPGMKIEIKAVKK